MNPNATSTIRLVVRGLGHVPSFKNSKMLTRGKLITNPKRQKWMQQCTDSLSSQLLCAYRISEGGMQTGRSLHSWTALFLPPDDTVHHIPEIHIEVEVVPKGEEGANIEITPL